MYPDDSFFTLSVGGQIGLVALSTSLAVFTLFLFWRIARGRHLAVRLGLAFAYFFLFVWLSPQVYYFYYLTLFDGLPFQSVVKAPPGPITLLDLLTFQDRATLSAHSKGILGWMLIVIGSLTRGVQGSGSADDQQQ